MEIWGECGSWLDGAIEEAVADSFGEVVSGDGGLRIEVSDGASDFKDTGVCATGDA